MEVERATISDIDALVELRLAYLTEDNGDLGADVTNAIERDLPGYYERRLGKDLFVYAIREREGGRIASCAFLLVVEKPMSPAFLSGKTGTVLNVYTRPDQRRRGHARRLMEALLADARAPWTSPSSSSRLPKTATRSTSRSASRTTGRSTTT